MDFYVQTEAIEILNPLYLTWRLSLVLLIQYRAVLRNSNIWNVSTASELELFVHL